MKLFPSVCRDEEFVKTGGKLIAFATPTLIDGKTNREPAMFFSRKQS